MQNPQLGNNSARGQLVLSSSISNSRGLTKTMGCGKSKSAFETLPTAKPSEPVSCSIQSNPSASVQIPVQPVKKTAENTESNSVSDVVIALKLHAATCLQASVRRRQSMVALKEMGHTSSLYVLETISKESMDGSISPRTVAALYKCEVFKNVPPDVLPAVFNNSRRKHYESGERVVAAGERSESMFIVCSGRLICEVNGVEVCIASLKFNTRLIPGC